MHYILCRSTEEAVLCRPKALHNDGCALAGDPTGAGVLASKERGRGGMVTGSAQPVHRAVAIKLFFCPHATCCTYDESGYKLCVSCLAVATAFIG